MIDEATSRASETDFSRYDSCTTLVAGNSLRVVANSASETVMRIDFIIGWTSRTAMQSNMRAQLLLGTPPATAQPFDRGVEWLVRLRMP